MKLYPRCFLLLFLILHSLQLITAQIYADTINNGVEKKRFLQIHDSSFLKNSYTTTSFADEEPLSPQLNTPRNDIFNEMAYCADERREWYYDPSTLRHMAKLCSYNYIELRYQRNYGVGDETVMVTFFASVHHHKEVVDSVQLIYRGASEEKLVTTTLSPTQKISLTLFQQDTSFLDKVEEIASHFSSFAEATSGGTTIHFHFSDYPYTISPKGAITQGSKILAETTQKRPSVAYRLASYSSELKNSGVLNKEHDGRFDSDLESKTAPQIITFSCNAPLGIIDLSVIVASDQGIASIQLEAGGEYSKTFRYSGEKRVGIRKNLPLFKGQNTLPRAAFDTLTSPKMLTLTVIDIHGNSAQETLTLYQDHRKIEEKHEKKKRTREKMRQWANEKPIRRILYGFTLISTLEKTPRFLLITKYVKRRALQNFEDREYQKLKQEQMEQKQTGMENVQGKKSDESEIESVDKE